MLDSEKYKVAKENYDWFIRDPEGYNAALKDKANKDKANKLKKAPRNVIELILEEALTSFKYKDRTCVDLDSYVSILNKALTVGDEATKLGLDGDKLSKRFIEMTLKQTLHLNSVLPGDIDDLSNHLPVFLNVVEVLLARINAPVSALKSACKELSSYSSKHLNTKSKCTGISSFDYKVNGISGAMSAIPAQSGSKNGGSLQKYPELTWLLSYRFKALGRYWVTKDFIAELTIEDLASYGVSENSAIAMLSAELKTTGPVITTIEDTHQLKFIQLSTDHGESFESLLVIPSTSYLEVVSEILRVNSEVATNLNAETNESKSTDIKGIPAYHRVRATRIDVSSDKPQNVSALYHELFEKAGLPRFNNILSTSTYSPELNKLYVIDSWFRSRSVPKKDVDKVNAKFSSMDSLLPMLPNKAKTSIKEGTISVAVHVLLSHLETQLRPLKSETAVNRIKRDEQKMTSKMGLLKLITEEPLTAVEAEALAECLANKLLLCPKSMRTDIIKNLMECWV